MSIVREHPACLRHPCRACDEIQAVEKYRSEKEARQFLEWRRHDHEVGCTAAHPILCELEAIGKHYLRSNGGTIAFYEPYSSIGNRALRVTARRSNITWFFRAHAEFFDEHREFAK